MSSTTYYQYKDVKVNIAHRLFNMDGWTVYGYHADNSDPMTDYYDPAYWGGIATKNGYTLVVDHDRPAEEYRRTYTVKTNYNPETAEKIAKLEKMTQANGASEQEEATAKAAILKLQEKQTAGEVEKVDYTPGHMANPPRCNWHIEKDGIIFDKGTGLLKFASVPDISREQYLKDWQDFNNQTPEEWKNNHKIYMMQHWNESEEFATRNAESAYNSAVEKYKLLDQFNILINRFNTIAGGMVGNSGENGYRYETIKVTKYKKVYKFQKTENGSFKNGQCFRLATNFNYGCYKGLVYRFIEGSNGEIVCGQRVSLKSNKTLTGLANSANSFGYYAADNATENHGRDKEKFLKWIANGSIEWGEVVEVSEPYEVEKVVKVDANGNEYKPNKAPKEEAPTEEKEINYIINEDTDTRDNSALWVVTLSDHVSREKFNEIREEMKNAGGYYSRFKRGFIFREDPTEKLNGVQTEETPTENTPQPQEAPEEVKPEEIPTDAPKTPYKPNYGYTGNTNELFNPDEIAQLKKGEQITKGEKWQKHAYFTTNYKNDVLFVYSVHIGDYDTMQPKTNADFSGIIYNNKYYTDFTAIISELKDDINNELLKIIPTEAAAIENAVNLESYDTERAETMRGFDYTKEAQHLFIDDKLPTLYLYDAYRRSLTATDAINYLLNPAEVVQEFATAYKKTHRADILFRYIEYNKTVTALNAIRSDKTNQAHILKRINEATKDGDEKTFRILLANGHTVKTNADAVRRLAYCGYISEWNVNSTDRQYLNHDERGRAEDIQPDEIKSISHGTKILYKAA